MLVSDLLHSCANECVAEAAVASIGGGFATRLQNEAEDRGVSVGFLAASIVRDFAVHAGERDWRELIDAVRGQDLPVLCGLRLILSRPDDGRRPTESRMRMGTFRFPVGAGEIHAAMMACNKA